MRSRLLAAGLFACANASLVAAEDPPSPPTPPAAADAAGPGITDGGQGQPWVSLSGSGLISLPDVATLPRRHLNVDLSIENQDRDPLRLDVVDYSAYWTYGIRPGLETYGHVVVSRAVIVADRPTLFVPPADIILPDGMSLPARPRYAFFAPLPYVNRSGSSQLAKFVPGDVVLGGKVRLLDPASRRPGVAVSAEVKVPRTRDLAKLQSGAGTGGVDVTGRVTAEWQPKHESIVASLGFTHVGGTPFGDRLIRFAPGQESAVVDTPLRLGDRLQFGLGVRHVLNPRIALVAEVTKTGPVGGRTPSVVDSGPMDVFAGGQLRRGRLHLTLCLRFHVNSVPSLRTYPYALAGLADMTSVSDADLRSYLAAVGASAALPRLRGRTQIALAIPADVPPLPEGARIIPSDFTVRSHDRVAYVFVWGWSFGAARKGASSAD